MSQSEVVRIRAQIDTEAAGFRRGLHGYAATTRHEIITNRYNRLGEHFQQLSARIGPFEAMKEVSEALEKHIGESTGARV